MDKKNFAEYISENMNISDTQADIIIDVFKSNLAQAMCEGNPVDLEEFGTFIPTIKLETLESQNHKYSISNNDIMFLPGSILRNNFISS